MSRASIFYPEGRGPVEQCPDGRESASRQADDAAALDRVRLLGTIWVDILDQRQRAAPSDGW